MYAVIELGGKQYKVAQGDEVLVDRINLDEGKSLSLTPLLVGGDHQAVTAAELKGAKVKAKIEEHLLGDKIRVFKYKPKSGYRRTKGHRSRLSRVSIQTITAVGGKKAVTKPEKKAETKAEAKPVKAEAKAETKARAKPKTEAKAEVKTAKKAGSKKTESKGEAKTAKKSESKAETKPAKKPEAKAETKTVKKAEAKAETKADAAVKKPAKAEKKTEKE